MSDMYLCLGTLSKTPYFLSGLGVNIYSMDELCYYLYRDAYILDNDLFDMRLCDYIRDNLEMSQLSDMIRQMIRDKKTLGEIVTKIFTVTGYCNEEEIKKVRQLLVDNASLSFAAKRKVRGDNLLKAEKYTRAIDEYQFVLSSLSKEEEPELYSSILHNIGSAYAQMFLLEKAASYYKEAYEIDKDRESLVLYLIALRISVSKEEFDRTIVRNGYDDRISLEAVRRMTSAREAAVDSPYGKQLEEVMRHRQKGKVSEYYKAVDETIDSWKADYRRSMK